PRLAGFRRVAGGALAGGDGLRVVPLSRVAGRSGRQGTIVVCCYGEKKETLTELRTPDSGLRTRSVPRSLVRSPESGVRTPYPVYLHRNSLKWLPPSSPNESN